MILIRNLKLSESGSESDLPKLAAKKLKVPENAFGDLRIVKKSLDARKKQDIHYVYSVAVSPDNDAAVLKRCRANADVSEWTPPVYDIPGCAETDKRPVIAGFGPAGMFAALVLSKAGLKPLVLERGSRVEERTAKVERFRSGGELDTECNVQFGEGGAGTFSDGKLNTGIKNPRIFWVLEQFALHGAPEHIRYDAKPHVGTDVLTKVVRSIREEIISLGGEVRFNTKLESLVIEDGALKGIKFSCGGETESMDCSELILAIGHSARDSFEMLSSLKVPMEPKPFSMGVRIEQLQCDTDAAQYGRERGSLPPADYALNVHLPDGESAYTFCMCPGGEVIAAASEAGGVVTNGMSLSDRSGENSNAALLVTLKPEDFPGRDVLAGMRWQREIEQAAYNYGGGSFKAPAQLTGDFLKKTPSKGPGRIKPSYRPGVVWGELHEVLPEKLTHVLEEALPELDRLMPGFASPDTVLTAPETRSSSPVRILRGENLSSAVKGLYPCGEGAGYAGGITSAAVDGMRCAEAVIQNHRP